jgi:hypothetical protein
MRSNLLSDFRERPCRFPLNLICVAAATLGSYYLVEPPFLELRRRIERSLVWPQAKVTLSGERAVGV